MPRPTKDDRENAHVALDLAIDDLLEEYAVLLPDVVEYDRSADRAYGKALDALAAFAAVCRDLAEAESE